LKKYSNLSIFSKITACSFVPRSLLSTILGCFQYANMERENLEDLVTCVSLMQHWADT